MDKKIVETSRDLLAFVDEKWINDNEQCLIELLIQHNVFHLMIYSIAYLDEWAVMKLENNNRWIICSWHIFAWSPLHK